MTPSTSLIHDFPAASLSPEQTEAFDHLDHAYKYLCDRFPCYGSRSEMRVNIDARLLVTKLRDAVLADSMPYFEGTLIEGLVSVAEKAERQ